MARQPQEHPPLPLWQVQKLEGSRMSSGGNKKRLEILGQEPASSPGPSQPQQRIEVGPSAANKGGEGGANAFQETWGVSRRAPPLDGDEILNQLIVDGHKVRVLCGKANTDVVEGVLDLRNFRIETAFCGTLLNLSGAEFERNCGMGQCKNWKKSVRVKTDDDGHNYCVKDFIEDLSKLGAYPPPSDCS